MPVRSTIYIFYMTCCVHICEKEGLGTMKIYIKHAINLHFNVRMSQCRDSQKKKETQLQTCLVLMKTASGIWGSLHQGHRPRTRFLRKDLMEKLVMGSITNCRGLNIINKCFLWHQSWQFCAGLMAPGTRHSHASVGRPLHPTSAPATPLLPGPYLHILFAYVKIRREKV